MRAISKSLNAAVERNGLGKSTDNRIFFISPTYGTDELKRVSISEDASSRQHPTQLVAASCCSNRLSIMNLKFTKHGLINS